MGKRLPKSVSGGLASLVMLASFAVSRITVWQLAGMAPEARAIEQTLYTWIASGDLNIDARVPRRPAVGGDDPGRSPASAR